MKPETLAPRPLWSIFSEICAIPHTSRNEAALVRWIRDRALAEGIDAVEDAAGNLLLRAPATPGHESAPGLVLQAHLDMVGQSESGAMHDFGRDPIRPRLSATEPDWLEASGTTLGADDGIGVAAALAFIESNECVHGPLECLFTVGEEDGMGGARAIGPAAFRGSVLLNLDHEVGTELCIGCAGTVRIRAELELRSEPAPEGNVWLTVGVEGLLGGHSGADIHLGRGNAGRVLAEILLRSGERIPWRLAAFEGGNAANAIPREARALVAVPTAARGDWRVRFERTIADLTRRLGAADPRLRATAVEAAPSAPVLPAERSASILASILALPNGLISLSPDVPGMVQSSCNLGMVKVTAAPKAHLEALAMVRSSSESEKEAIAAEVETIFADLGASTSRPAAAPAWSPEPDSRLLALARDTYRELFGAEAVVMATHGGLECGLFRPVFPRVEMLSIGPTIRFPHSPREAVHLPSVESFWRFLVGLAGRLAAAQRS
ncbi:MAG: beta-Ala-His dipeptidase [Rectinemataceae bacterium]